MKKCLLFCVIILEKLKLAKKNLKSRKGNTNMKKLFLLLITLTLLLILPSCEYEYNGKTVGDYKIDFSNSMSIVVKRQNTPTQIFKAFDEEGNPFLLELGHSGDITAEFEVRRYIELPETIMDFEIIGYSGNNEFKCDLLLNTNDGFYIVSPLIDRQFDYLYDIYKIDDDICINTNFKNILYKSDSCTQSQVFYNNVLKNTSIINENNNICYICEEQKIILLDNAQLLNAFFIVEYDQNYTSPLAFRQFVIIDVDNKAYYYSLSDDFDVHIQKKMEYEKKIIDYGVIGSRWSNVSKYFYILTEDSLFIYEESGELFYSMKVEEKVYGINFVNGISVFEIQLAFKTKDDLFKWDKKTIERNNLNEK